MNDPVDTPTRYEIQIKGHLSAAWVDYFNDTTITQIETNTTQFTCMLADQADLHALLRKIRDLGLELISIQRITTDSQQ